MDLENLNAPRPALPPQTRACLNCAHAKTKCIMTSGVGGKCERCQRMNKVCEPGPKQRKKRTVKKPPVSKNAKLEEKLDGLVTLLKSATHIKDPLAVLDTSTSFVERRQPIGAIVDSLSDLQRDYAGPVRPMTQQSITPSDTPSIYSIATPVQQISDAAEYEILPSLEEAQLYLDRCKREMLNLLPHVVLPPLITSEQLREERPFLWRCIMAVGSRRLSQQRALMDNIRYIISQKMLFEGEKVMDLLLGLLVYISWWHFYNRRGLKILTNLVQLALAQVFELGLNRPVSNLPRKFVLEAENPSGLYQGQPYPQRSGVRTMEERRAFVGCYILSSMTSTFLQQMDPMRRTSYLEETIRMLAETPEYPSDALLAQYARLQLIEDDVCQAPWIEGEGISSDSRAPSSYHLKSLEAQMKAFKQQLPTELQQNDMLLMLFHNIEIRIYSTALSPNCDLPEPLRLDALYHCSRACKAFFHVFLSLPRGKHTTLPFIIYTQISHCMSTIGRLLFFDYPMWDLQACREGFEGEHNILKKLISLFDQTKFENPDYDIEEGSVFAHATMRMKRIDARWDKNRQREGFDPMASQQQAPTAGVPGPSELPGPSGPSGPPVVDDPLVQGLMGSFFAMPLEDLWNAEYRWY